MEREWDARLRRIVRQRLESLRQSGVVELLRAGRWCRSPVSAEPFSTASSPGPAPTRSDQVTGAERASSTAPPTGPAAPRPAAPEEPAQMPAPQKKSLAAQSHRTSAPAPDSGSTSLVPDQSAAERQTALQSLAAQVAACTRCVELADTRTQTVFGAGSPQARLVFIGEAPGADEDRRGEPFVGRAGQLLTDIITACTLRREDVYIVNILKCRPPGNRNPSPAEAANCRPFLLRQLEVIRPEFICCLGAVAAQNLLETTEAIGRLRGRFHEFQGIRVMATYHPAYLLRNPSAKQLTWNDLKMLMKEMGIRIPKRSTGSR